MNLTDPSRKPMFTPPEWFEWAAIMFPYWCTRLAEPFGELLSWLLPQHDLLLGVVTWLYPPPTPFPELAQEKPWVLKPAGLITAPEEGDKQFFMLTFERRAP